jgi:phage terminase small subunit
MTEKQKRFAEEYTIDYKSIESAIRAGYPANLAKELSIDLHKVQGVKDHFNDHILDSNNIGDSESTILINYWIEVMRSNKRSDDYKLAVSDLLARHLYRCQKENPYVTKYKS